MAVIVSLERARREGATPQSILSVVKWHEEQAKRDKHRRGHHIEVAKGLRVLADQLKAA